MNLENNPDVKIEIIKFSGIAHPANEDGTRTIFNWIDYNNGVKSEIYRIPEKKIPFDAYIYGNYRLKIVRDSEGNDVSASIIKFTA